MEKSGRLLKPIEPLLLPQLEDILDKHIETLDNGLYAITSRMGDRGARNFNDSAHAVENAELIKKLGLELFSGLAKQIIQTYCDRRARPASGATHFNDYSLKFINYAFEKMHRADNGPFPNSDHNKRLYTDAKNKLIKKRETYVNQLCKGYVDGVNWRNLSIEKRVSQVMHIHNGDRYHVEANGSIQPQMNMGASTGTQYNSFIQNDLLAIQKLIAEIQNSTINETEKDDLSVPLERIIQEAENGSSDGRFLRTACRELLMRIQSGAYDKLSQAALDGTQAAVEKLLSLAAA